MTFENLTTDTPATDPQAIAQRRDVTFRSGETRCAAWHYPGTNGACVIMAGGTAITRGPASDQFAPRFHAAGYTVLAFDFRHFGDSGGEPRQVVRLAEQRADWHAAIAFARALPGVDPRRIALWAFSLAGGEILEVAAAEPELAAAIAQAPLVDGPAVAPNAFRHMTPLAFMRLTGRAVLDAMGAVVGREPLLIALGGPRGSVASVTTPDALDGPGALNPGNRHPDWRQEVAARSTLAIGSYRPVRSASRVRCPLLVLAYDDDATAVPGAAVRAGERAPRGEVVRLPGRHYAAFLEAHEQTVEAELAFLRRHVLG